MLVVVADSNVVKAASEDPVPPPGIDDAGNDTAPPPVVLPPPPPDEPQRPVEPGTVTQGWDNSSFAPSEIADHRDPSLQDSDNQTLYETTYGSFVLNKSSPYFIRVLNSELNQQETAESAFLVLFQGQLLSPVDGTIDNATRSQLTFHYGLYLADVLQGTMTVDYSFHRDD